MPDPIVIGDGETPSVALNTGALPNGSTNANVEAQAGGQVSINTFDGIDTAAVSVGGGIGIIFTSEVGVAIPNLPTSDPHMAGYLFSDNGTVKVSAG